MAASSSSSTKVCFNSNCNEVLEQARKGWRRRTGEYADLCDRCASAFDEGKFCETFHTNTSGWRNCECCKKSIHCGCIVSFHMFVLLDAGGIECLTCARKSFILTPNPAWPPPSLLLPQMPERLKDLSVKNWNPIAGSGPVPWRQAPGLFHASTAQLELPHRMPFEVEIPGGIDRLISGELFNASSLDKKKKEDASERLMNGSLKIGASEILGSGTTGIKYDGQPKSFINVYQQSSFLKDEPTNPHFSLPVTSGLKNEGTDQTQVFGANVQRTTPPTPVGKQFNNNNGTDSSGEAQIRNGRSRAEPRGKNQLLPRYWPRITDQELQQLSADSKSKITPLFEKILSASDAGRIGRLVLPKKCAEAYLPPISQPEGLPLIVQDLKGKEWVFQFRFWPNNNSRMYVLEGVTPCIQSMQLQAGDIVTFSRIEPEGKLVMGFRKVSTASPSDQVVNETVCTSNGVSYQGDVSTKSAAGEVVSNQHNLKVSSPSTLFSSINQAGSGDPASRSNVDKSAYIAKEVLGPKVAFRSKRKKNSTMGLKSKCIRHENDEMIELNISWGQAQDLFRPPPDIAPTVMVIEGVEFEEYEEAPIIGRPTIFATNSVGESRQWAQCEDCFKWRKVPADVLFPSRWTCSENLWDPERSLCSADEELTLEELENLFPRSCWAASKRKKSAKLDPDPLETLEGLDALAHLAIQEDGEAASSSQATTKHPRHRPGCTCIVCMQPPSGKGPKHKQSCTCSVCQMVRRRFRTLMIRRAKKQFEKEAETRQKLLLSQLPELPDDDVILSADNGSNSPNHKMGSNEGSDDEPNKQKISISPFKNQIIDLNIQPEREEELSPASESIGMMKLLQDTTERYFRQQRLSDCVNGNSVGSQTHMDGIRGGNFSNGISADSNRQNADTATKR